jgi:hypothetical protein
MAILIVAYDQNFNGAIVWIFEVLLFACMIVDVFVTAWSIPDIKTKFPAVTY